MLMVLCGAVCWLIGNVLLLQHDLHPMAAGFPDEYFQGVTSLLMQDSFSVFSPKTAHQPIPQFSQLIQQLSHKEFHTGTALCTLHLYQQALHFLL